MSRRVKVDLLVNYASLGVLAAGGLVMNLVVVKWMGEAALGLFNQAYAIYIAGSQLAVGGVHISVLRSVAQTPNEAVEQAPIVASGLALSAGLGALLCLIVMLTRDFWGAFLGSPGVVDSLAFVAPALILFSLNKTLLSTLNGLRRMRVFAALQALRFFVLIAVLAAVAWYRRPVAELSASLLLAELVVLLVAAPCVMSSVRLGFRHIEKVWLRHHVVFGAKGLLSGVFIELNTRIDVLAIGFFLSDRDVGRYSLAAVFAEGLYQCLVVVRNQVNPVLARMLLLEDPQPLVSLVHKAWRYLYPGMALAYLAGFGVFQLILTHYAPIPDSGNALVCYAILGAGVVAIAGFVPFDGVLLHSGKPAFYTLFTFSIAASNAILNVLLIPLLGIQGAALATALALLLSIPSLSKIMRWQLGFTYLSRNVPRQARPVPELGAAKQS